MRDYITEISEEDFRKLDIKAYAWTAHESPNWKEMSMNKVLDSAIKYLLEVGDEQCQKDLNVPITIAIHKENGPKPKDYYLDKYVSILGPATYAECTGARHIYITRDYFESKEWQWRVKKSETKSIYRIHLSEKWKKQFILKRKLVKEQWPFPLSEKELEKDEEKRELWTYYRLNQETGLWEIYSQSMVVHYVHSTCVSIKNLPPVDKE